MRRILSVAITLAAAFAAMPLSAQEWPARAIKVIVPLTAGAATDIMARAVFEQVSVQLKQPIVMRTISPLTRPPCAR